METLIFSIAQLQLTTVFKIMKFREDGSAWQTFYTRALQIKYAINLI